jgi:diguanylate cyclase (GGDEF)-like protein
MNTPSAEILLPEELVNAFTLLPQEHRRRPPMIDQLRHTEDRLAEAERLIAEQERRIRQLEELADTDMLSGLMNRRGFERFFGTELARMQRHHSEGSYLLLIDLDLFKKINDEYGHQAGDACLKEVAKILTGSTRIVDASARFGGDEFAVLLTQTDADRAAERIQTLRDLLNSITVEWNGKTLRLGASIGGAPVRKDSTLEAAYREADKRLYMDKHNRKRVK